MSLIEEGRQVKRGKCSEIRGKIQTPGYPQYPRLSQLLKKGYLGYLPQCTACLKASHTRLSKTHLPSLDPREPVLVKLPPPRIDSKLFTQKAEKVGESITV